MDARKRKWLRGDFRFVVAVVGMLWSLVVRPIDATELWRSAAATISVPELERHVTTLADDSFEGREPGTAGGQAAAGYLVRALKELGLRPAGDRGFFQDVPGGYRNLLGMMPGSDPSLKHEVVICCAHYDHVGYGNWQTSRGPIGYIHNGADDNASGVAGLLEVADAMRQLSTPPSRSILFALWDGEESGLHGSRHWGAHPTVLREHIVIGLNLDMIGRLRDGRVKVYGSRTAPGLRYFVSQLNDDLPLTLEFPWEMKANSDHYSLCQAGMPVLMLHTGLHDDYHTPRDDTDKINNDGMQRVTQLAFRIAWQLAHDPRRWPHRAAAMHETKEQERQFLDPGPSPPSRLGISWREPLGHDDQKRSSGQGDDPSPHSDQGTAGLVVTQVIPGSPAATAGIAAGDRLLQFDGRPLRQSRDLQESVFEADTTAILTWQRQNGIVNKSILSLSKSVTRLGISWRETEGEPQTVTIMRVAPGSPAERAELAWGDRIHRVNGKAIADGPGFARLIQQSNDILELEIERGGHLRKVSVTYGE